MNTLYAKSLFFGLLWGSFITNLMGAEAKTAAPTWPQPMVISVPVADLMSKPQRRNQNYEKCPFQATQLLYGERVQALEQQGNWIRVKALEQSAHWNGAWINCNGWIEKHQATPVKEFYHQNLFVTSHSAPLHLYNSTHSPKLHTLPFGTKLAGLTHTNGWWKVYLPDQSYAAIQDCHVDNLDTQLYDTEQKRALLIERAMKFLGDPYLWAGRSACNVDISPHASGLDCSGYMNVLFNSINVPIPRCAHDQHEKSQKLRKLDRMNKGDMMFIYYQDPEKPGEFKERIGHVLMYLGNDRLIEAEGDFSGHVRVVLGRQRFGKPVESLVSGQIVEQFKALAESPMGNKKVLSKSPVGRCKVAFGTYLQ